MKTVTQHQPRLVGFLLVAGTIGLLLLMHLVSAPHQSCEERETRNAGVLKLI